MGEESWLNHPGLDRLDPAKKELLRTLSAQSAGKPSSEMAPLLMAMVTQANKKRLSFSPDEMNLLIEIMKQNRPKEEQERIDQMVNMTSNMMKTRRPE